MIPSCTIIGTVVAKPESRAELQDILAALVAPTRAETGCLRYDFHVDASDPSVFVFYENWRSQADLDIHLTQPHLQTLFDRQGELLARPVEIRHLTMLSEPAD
jgi:quinol monooxygenase YgiN